LCARRFDRLFEPLPAPGESCRIGGKPVVMQTNQYRDPAKNNILCCGYTFLSRTGGSARSRSQPLRTKSSRERPLLPAKIVVATTMAANVLCCSHAERGGG
jgi:hypothetical protein